MPSRISWKNAQRPNYSVNVDKLYPYSEVPYLGEYNLVRLPVLTGMIDHVDYWGEGRIETQGGVSGFVDCYNVNHEYQLVSNGPDADKKIPNRVPVISYTNCDTSGYIRSNSVKLVTLIGSPINKSCATDMVRMVNDRYGKVVVFGFEEGSAYIKNLEDELKNKTFVYCPDYILPSQLKGLTLFPSSRTYLNAGDTKIELCSHIESRNYEKAITLTNRILASGYGVLIKETVMGLINNSKNTVIDYGYQLWISGAKEVIFTYFPEPFKQIYNQDQVTITNKQYILALKLDANTDQINDRLAWGDAQDKTSKRVAWKLLPVWDQVLYFKLIDMDRHMYLKLAVDVDDIGDRQAWGSDECDTNRHQWYLVPMEKDGEILFNIMNREYGQGLKLGIAVDSYNDRLLWGSGEPVSGNPLRYGWLIEAWKSQ